MLEISERRKSVAKMLDKLKGEYGSKVCVGVTGPAGDMENSAASMNSLRGVWAKFGRRKPGIRRSRVVIPSSASPAPPVARITAFVLNCSMAPV